MCHGVCHLQHISEEYMERMNCRIRELSSATVVSFIYLGPPPTEAASAVRYLRLLDILTKDLPPLMLMHGVDTVVDW